MSGFLKLTRYDRACANPGRPVFVNVELIATIERYCFGEDYTRVELAGGVVLKVVEQPDVIIEHAHYARLEVTA